MTASLGLDTQQIFRIAVCFAKTYGNKRPPVARSSKPALPGATFWGGRLSGRIRTIKPEWLEDERLVMASPEARVLSVALILMADDHGNGRMVIPVLAPRIFPASPGIFARALVELAKTEFVRLYRCKGQSYFSIRNWAKHQRVDKPGKPRVPGPLEPGVENIIESLAKVIESLAPDPDPDPDLDHDLFELKNPPLLLEANPKPKRGRPKKSTEETAESVKFNRRYCELYEQHVNAKPVLDAQANSQLKRFVAKYVAEAFGMLEAFFGSSNPFYRARGFSVQTLCTSADALRVEMRKQSPVARIVTADEALAMEQRQQEEYDREVAEAERRFREERGR